MADARPRFGALLRRHRLAAGLTQEALAERAGLSGRAVSDLERDPGRLPRLDSVAHLAAALGLTGAPWAAFHAAAYAAGARGDHPQAAFAPDTDTPPRPATRYARNGDIALAYQILGDGPVDLIVSPGVVSHVEWNWEEPRLARELRALATFSRLILFDKRGTGLSDRVLGAATLEERMDDTRAVLDAAGSSRAVVYGVNFGAALALLFAASYPERTLGVIGYAAEATQVRQPDYPWKPPAAAAWRALAARGETIHEHWGDTAKIAALVARAGPSLAGDEAFVRWFATLERLAASPGDRLAFERLNLALDVRAVLPSIRAPALILHRVGDRMKDLAEGRYVAAHIPGARFVALPGDDHFSFAGDTAPLLAAIRDFVAAVAGAAVPDRVLTTALAATLVGPPGGATTLPPARAAAFRALAGRELTRHQGARATVGDTALLATFDGPVRAVRCAQALVAGAAALGLGLRVGLHTGECMRGAGPAQGPVAEVAPRVAAQARPGEVLATRVVRDLLAGAGLQFVARGAAGEVAGAGALHLYAVS